MCKGQMSQLGGVSGWVGVPLLISFDRGQDMLRVASARAAPGEGWLPALGGRNDEWGVWYICGSGNRMYRRKYGAASHAPGG